MSKCVVWISTPSDTVTGAQGYEEAISFSNWDMLWYTRGFRSMDTERMRRHASKLLTYPMTIGSTLHQYSNLTTRNQRLTPEGARSLAGEHAMSATPSHNRSYVAQPCERPCMFLLVPQTCPRIRLTSLLSVSSSWGHGRSRLCRLTFGGNCVTFSRPPSSRFTS